MITSNFFTIRESNKGGITVYPGKLGASVTTVCTSLNVTSETTVDDIIRQSCGRFVCIALFEHPKGLFCLNYSLCL